MHVFFRLTQTRQAHILLTVQIYHIFPSMTRKLLAHCLIESTLTKHCLFYMEYCRIFVNLLPKAKGLNLAIIANSTATQAQGFKILAGLTNSQLFLAVRRINTAALKSIPNLVLWVNDESEELGDEQTFDTIDLSVPTNRFVADRSYATWVERGTGRWTGWCVPWAAILNVHFGNPVRAVGLLHDWETYYCNPGHGSLHNAYLPGFTAWTISESFVNSGDGQVMQMDGQCAAVTAILEMMVHEINGEVGYFRGCPETWRDVSFENVALSDGRRVSGSRKDGVVKVDVIR